MLHDWETFHEFAAISFSLGKLVIKNCNFYCTARFSLIMRLSYSKDM